MAAHIPKVPSGHVPGASFVDTGAPYGLKVGLITRVDDVTLKCDIKILTGGGERCEVHLTQGMAGPRSFWGGVPEKGSLVIIGYRRKSKQLHEAVILGYIPSGNRLGLKFDPFASDDPANVSPEDQAAYDQLFGPAIRYKRMRLRSGDVGGMSAAGAEFSLSKDVRLVNRAGDLFELRDADRTLVAQSVHRVESESGVFRVSGPVRRGGFFLPPDIFRGDTKQLKDAADPERYFGRSLLKRFTNASGIILDSFNNPGTYPPVTFSNGRRVHYPSTTPGVNFEDPNEGGGSEPFTEWRMEMSHTTDCTQEVREEIDGFQMDRRPIFIEHALGTLVGNDTSSESGQQQYGLPLRPKLFDDFDSTGPGSFALEGVPRSPTDDIETFTTAGAYLLRINPPESSPKRAEGNSVFAVAVSKQGKLFANIPGSRVERYPSGVKNVSAEVNMEGALKVRLGRSTPDNVSLHLTCEGGVVADIGSSTGGQAIKVRYHSSVTTEYQGVQDENDVACSESVTGNKEAFCSGDSVQNVAGSKQTTVNGLYGVQSDRFNINATSGASHNVGQMDFLCSGKSQYQYALQVLETIVAGGKVSTILAGGQVENLVAGARSINVLGGAMSTVVAAGAYSVTVGGGAITMTAGAAITQTAAIGFTITAGATVAITAGLAINLTAPAAIILSSLQVLLGAPVAVFGVSRGAPMMPPGTPSLCWITGLPVMGAALIRAI